MSPESKLAVQVLNKAIEDFNAIGLTDTPSNSSRLFAQLHGNKKLYRLHALRQKIAAGVFLLERKDPVKLLWFTLAGLDPEAVARHARWRERLDGLKAAERALLQQRPRAYFTPTKVVEKVYT